MLKARDEGSHHLSTAYHGVVTDQTTTQSFKIDQQKLSVEKLGTSRKSQVWKMAQLVCDPHSIVLSHMLRKMETLLNIYGKKQPN